MLNVEVYDFNKKYYIYFYIKVELRFMVFNTTFINISAMVVSVTGGGDISTQRKLPTYGKSLTNFIT
jgi:hypothetical protein